MGSEHDYDIRRHCATERSASMMGCRFNTTATADFNQCSCALQPANKPSTSHGGAACASHDKAELHDRRNLAEERAAFARVFAAAGYRIALLSRSTSLSERLAGELGDAKAYA